MLVLGNRGLETAIANGDTRTITMHHIHTGEDITITYKRDGKYDEEALKQLDWFVRDWREEESMHMDPQLYDLVWEVHRQSGSEQPIQVVCGYRSPKTNAMLRRRTNGVAQHSQHMLGKAMDLFMPGAVLEEVRNIGLRLQRGGVGYYPHSGAPFVHLDVGPVRHWGPIPAEAVARAMSGAHVASAATSQNTATSQLSTPQPSTSQVSKSAGPVSEAMAFAAADKRSASAPTQPSSRAARAHGKSAPAAVEDDEDEAADAATAAAATQRSASAARRNAGAFTLASAESRPVPAARPVRTQPSQIVAPITLVEAAPAAVASAPVKRQDWAYATEAPRPPEPVTGVSRADDDVTATMRTADNDRVPLEMVMSYAAQPQPDRDTLAGLRPDSPAEAALRGSSARSSMLRDTSRPASHEIVSRDNVTTVAKKTFVHPASLDSVVRAKPEVAANVGMRYDDPWLRAMMLAPSISSDMTATLYGDPDFSELRTLMNKPTSTLVMSFGDEAYPGIAANRFSGGDAVVFLNTHSFERRLTAALH
jgi:uncharacterized protein YcbK (DUF882 family)